MKQCQPVSLDHTEKQDDLRIRRTRHLLQQAFTQLMTEKQFQSITVQEITERAMVHRATFYDHFVDKYDLLEYAIREEFRHCLQRKLPQTFTCSPDNLDLLVATTCEFLLFLSGQCVARDKQIMGMVQTQITTQIQDLIVKWLTAFQPEHAIPPEHTAAITGWAIYGAAVYWSQHSDQMPLEEFVRLSRPRLMTTLDLAPQQIN